MDYGRACVLWQKRSHGMSCVVVKSYIHFVKCWIHSLIHSTCVMHVCGHCRSTSVIEFLETQLPSEFQLNVLQSQLLCVCFVFFCFSLPFYLSLFHSFERVTSAMCVFVCMFECEKAVETWTVKIMVVNIQNNESIEKKIYGIFDSD